MEKNNLRTMTTNPLTPPPWWGGGLTAVKDSMVFFKGFPKEVLPKKKLLTFGYCSKVALTLLSPTLFGHSWGNFGLYRFRKNKQLKTTSKQPKKNHKIISKLSPKTTPKLLDQVQPSLPTFLCNLQKKAQNLLDLGWTAPPPLLWQNVQK